MSAVIYILHDRMYDTATSYLEANIREVFNDNVKIREVSKSDLSDNSIWYSKNSLLFITPPIMGEKCHYSELYTKSISKKRLDYVNNGGVTFDLCAGAYHAFSTIHWKSPTDGKSTEKETHSTLFKGTAYGPLEGLGCPSDPQNRYSDCIITPIETLVDGQLLQLGCYYGNGCSFITDDSNIETLAVYRHNEQKAPAIVKRAIGQGFAIASGILPHYQYQPRTVPALEALNAQIKPHEKSRRQLMHAILRDIAQQGIKKKILTDKDLVTHANKLPQLTPLIKP